MTATLGVSVAVFTPVIVRAETVRVSGVSIDGVARFKQTTGPRDMGRYQRHCFADHLDWPGSALPASWTLTVEAFDIEPPVGRDPLVRLRRFEFVEPVQGVVIGGIHRKEGVVVHGNALGGPFREVSLFEVALASNRRALIAQVHRHDLVPLQ